MREEETLKSGFLLTPTVVLADKRTHEPKRVIPSNSHWSFVLPDRLDMRNLEDFENNVGFLSLWEGSYFSRRRRSDDGISSFYLRNVGLCFRS